MTYSSIITADDIDVPKELRQDKESQYEYLLSNSVTLMHVINGENRYVYLNNKFCDITGFDKEELLGAHLSKVFTDETLERGRCKTFQLWNDEKEETEMWRGEIETKDGEIVPVELKFSLLPRTEEGEYNGLAAIARDIREQQRRETKLQIMSRVLRHNLRNSAGVIQGNAELFKSADDPALQQAAETVQETAEELLEMGTKVRKVQEEIQANPSAKYETEITHHAHEVADKFRDQYEFVPITVDTPDEDVIADVPSAYRTALEELVENAIEHSPNGIGAKVDIEIKVDEDYAITEVRDVCRPIPENEIEVIKSGKETDLSHSSGLGLWLAHWIADTAGGNLRFDRYTDEEREGNCISIILNRR